MMSNEFVEVNIYNETDDILYVITNDHNDWGDE